MIENTFLLVSTFHILNNFQPQFSIYSLKLFQKSFQISEKLAKFVISFQNHTIFFKSETFPN